MALSIKLNRWVKMQFGFISFFVVFGKKKDILWGNVP